MQSQDIRPAPVRWGRRPGTPFAVLALALALVLPVLTPRSARADDDPFAGAPALTPEVLVEAVLARNPTLESSRQAWREALGRVPQAGSLDDPTVSYSFAPLSVPADSPPYGHSIELRQRFPFPGKLSLREQTAQAEADAARGDMDAVRLRLAAMAVRLYADYGFTGRALEINREHLQLLEDLRRVAVARYTAGEGSQDEPLSAEVETAQLDRRRIQLQADLEVARAGLNALLHRGPDAPLPPVPAEAAPAEMAPEPESDRETEALDARPDLRAAEARVRGGRALVDLAGKSSWPDFTLMAQYSSMWAMTEHRWMVGVMVNLPLRTGTRRGERQEARAKLERMASDRDALKDRIRLEVRTAGTRVREADDLLDLYRSRLLPAARDRISAARAAYETGRTTFLHVIEAERDLRDAELQYEDARASLLRAQADLDRALGRMPGLPGEGE